MGIIRLKFKQMAEMGWICNMDMWDHVPGQIVGIDASVVLHAACGISAGQVKYNAPKSVERNEADRTDAAGIRQAWCFCHDGS